MKTPTRRKPRHFRHSFALEGEDMILSEMFTGKQNGFFVDVGAYHPRRFSNTYHLYRFRGWRGINIDANPGAMKAFGRVRPEDINIEAAVSDEPRDLSFFIFNEPALNTFDPQLAAERDGLNGFSLLKTVPIQTTTLAAILREHAPEDRPIDLLTVDVEGFDLQVLRSNDWQRYRPEIVLAEDVTVTFWNQIASSPLTMFLQQQGYEPIARTVRTTFYRRVGNGNR